MAKLNFTPRQQTTITAAMTAVAGAVIAAIVMGLLGLLGWFVVRFSNVIFPLVVAAIFGLVFKPYYEWLLARVRHRPLVAVLLLYLSVLLPLVMFVWRFGELLAGQLAKLPSVATEVWRQICAKWPTVLALLERYGIHEKWQGLLSEHGNFLVGVGHAVLETTFSTGSQFITLVAGAMGWVVFPIYLGFFMMAKPWKNVDMEQLFPFFKPSTRQDLLYLIEQFVMIIVAFFRGQLVIAFLQGILFACGFAIVGLKYGFVLGLMLGLLNMVPYLGSLLGLAMALPLAYFQPDGGLGVLVGVLVVFGIVQTVEGYVLTPKIMGDRTGLHPVVIMVAVFFWSSALQGMLGLLLAVPLTAFLVVFWRLVKEKYIKAIV